MARRLKCVDPVDGVMLAAYEAGLLPPREQALFEAHLEICDACSEELFELAQHIAALQQQPQRTAVHMAAVATGGERAVRAGPAWWLRPWARLRELAHPTHPTTIHPPRWAMLVPVAVALIVMASLVVDQTRIPKLPTLAELVPLPHLTLATRGSADPTMQEYDQGMERYASGDFAAAAEHLTTAVRGIGLQPHPPEGDAPSQAARELQRDQAALYAGISWLLTSQPDSARTYLDLAERSRFPLISEHAIWYRAQLRMTLDDRQGATRHLRRLAESSMLYGEQALELLERIEQL